MIFFFFFKTFLNDQRMFSLNGIYIYNIYKHHLYFNKILIYLRKFWINLNRKRLTVFPKSLSTGGVSVCMYVSVPVQFIRFREKEKNCRWIIWLVWKDINNMKRGGYLSLTMNQKVVKLHWRVINSQYCQFQVNQTLKFK